MEEPKDQDQPGTAHCKFRCTGITHGETASKEIVLSAQYDPTLEKDRAFSEYTPSGRMQFTLNNPRLDGFFVPGKQYHILITEVE